MSGLVVNKSKIKKADIAIGVPSYNEADTIKYVILQIDKGLKKYFPNKKAVIINIDNHSPDNTKKAFLAVKTKTPTVYISTPAGTKGKGRNVYNFLVEMKKLNAEVGALIDADLTSITPEWVKCLVEPVLKKDYDFVLPIYKRNEYDGSITNHICYPLVYGILGHNIRQPIGGEFGFSGKVAEYWLKQKWTKEIKEYGVHIFMALNAIKGGFNVCNVDLGVKAHKPSLPKLGPMFLQVSDSLFGFLARNRKLWDCASKIQNPPVVCSAGANVKPQEIAIEYKSVKSKAMYEFSVSRDFLKENLSPKVFNKLDEIFLKKKVLNINSTFWAEVLYEMLNVYINSHNKEAVVRALRSLYFGRVVSFIKSTLEKSHVESENDILKQAKRFRKKRSYLLDRCK